jgi:phosphoribosylanthranilate isomerase
VRRVKICGITSQADLEIAIGAGASALGFLVGLLHPSADRLDAEAAAALILRVPPLVESVLVTHRSEPAIVSDLCARTRAGAVQLQGDFPLAAIDELRRAHPRLRILKAVHVTGPEAIETAWHAARFADAILLDSIAAGRLGGTGAVHDWSISRAIRDAVAPTTPVILAGGLRPENVRSAIERVDPFAVDVNSGVSVRPGLKDAARVQAFVREAHSTP